MKYVAAVAATYQLVAIAACLWHLYRPRRPAGDLTAVSVLKPVNTIPLGFEAALRSHTEQDYPRFEVLAGSTKPGCQTPNRKVGVLIDLAKLARYPILVVNDADIEVPPNYLREVTAPLTDPRVGLVTCIYRAVGDTWPSRFEALGVATDFAPSALVAPFVGVSEFGLGSTLAFRRADLDRMGGLAAIADYLADDYQLGCKLHSLGLRNVIARPVVSTRLHGNTWGKVWRHQLRWARTIRLSRKGGYAGLPVTFATVWAIAAACAGLWWIAAGLVALRLAMAITAGWLVLRSLDVLKLFWLIPVRDLYGAAVWAAALFGNTVEWGGETLTLDSDGRIVGHTSAGATGAVTSIGNL
ncbi:MAG: glycosyltransferase [Bryobacteraceae bacterium]